jgi:hypothetical protein
MSFICCGAFSAMSKARMVSGAPKRYFWNKGFLSSFYTSPCRVT